MAALLSSGATGGGGRGGQLRLKLYVSLLWVCAAAPYSAHRPARAWAALLGLDDPAGRGARRINATFTELQSRQLVALRERGGHPTEVTLLSDFGTGQPYLSPSEVYNHYQHQGYTAAQLEPHRYFRLPSTLWTTGQITRLTGPGLAMLLVLRCEQRGHNTKPVWFSPDRAANRFGLSESTRRLGLQQLREQGVLATGTRRLSESGEYIDIYRQRQVHLLDLARMAQPGVPPQPMPPTLDQFFGYPT